MVRLIAALVLTIPTLAAADLTLVNEVVSGGKTRTVTVSAKGSKAFFELKESEGPTRTMLHDGEAKKLFLIDHPAKTYMVVTEQDSQALVEKQAQFRAQLQAQLAKMPPEQRARIESTMLADQPTADVKAPVNTYEKKKGPARKVSGFSCEDYLIKRGDKLIGEGCFTSWKNTGLPADDFKATLKRAMPTGPNGNPMGQAFDANDSAPGFPVWRTHLDDTGKVTTETTVKSLSKTAMPAANFQLPKDYTEKSLAPPKGQLHHP